MPRHHRPTGHPNRSVTTAHPNRAMPIMLLVVPALLVSGVVGAIGFASQETEDMSPSEQTLRMNK